MVGIRSIFSKVVFGLEIHPVIPDVVVWSRCSPSTLAVFEVTVGRVVRVVITDHHDDIVQRETAYLLATSLSNTP